MRGSFAARFSLVSPRGVSRPLHIHGRRSQCAGRPYATAHGPWLHLLAARRAAPGFAHLGVPSVPPKKTRLWAPMSDGGVCSGGPLWPTELLGNSPLLPSRAGALSYLCLSPRPFVRCNGLKAGRRQPLMSASPSIATIKRTSRNFRKVPNRRHRARWVIDAQNRVIFAAGGFGLRATLALYSPTAFSTGPKTKLYISPILYSSYGSASMLNTFG